METEDAYQFVDANTGKVMVVHKYKKPAPAQTQALTQGAMQGVQQRVAPPRIPYTEPGQLPPGYQAPAQRKQYLPVDYQTPGERRALANRRVAPPLISAESTTEDTDVDISPDSQPNLTRWKRYLGP